MLFRDLFEAKASPIAYPSGVFPEGLIHAKTTFEVEVFSWETGSAFLDPGREGGYTRNLLAAWMSRNSGSRFALFSTGVPLELPFFRRVLNESGSAWDLQAPGSAWFGISGGLGSKLARSGATSFHSWTPLVPPARKGEAVFRVFSLPEVSASSQSGWMQARKWKAMVETGHLFLARSGVHAASWVERFPELADRIRVLYPIQDGVFFYRKRPEAIAKLIYEWDLVERPFVVWETHLATDPRAREVLSAFESLIHQIPDDLVVLGPRGDAAYNILKDVPALQGRVRLLGEPGSEQRTNLLDGASFVLQTGSEQAWAPGMAEALVRGKAVVAFPSPLLSELAETAALFAQSLEEWKDAIRSLSLNLELRKTREENSRLRGRFFSPESWVSKYAAWMEGRRHIP